MIQETNVILRKQTPNTPNEWLYLSSVEDGIETRNFVASVYLGANTEPWQECTNEEKIAWEEAHKEEKAMEEQQ